MASGLEPLRANPKPLLLSSNDVKLEPCELGKNSDPLPALLMAALLPLFYMWPQGWWRCGRVWCPRPGTKLFPPPTREIQGCVSGRRPERTATPVL